jgi:site-specific recombinase XerD
VAIQALLGHSTINATQIYANVGQERMQKGVARL